MGARSHAARGSPDSRCGGAGRLGEGGLVELRETTRLHTSDPRYRWVNTLAVRATGTADLARGEIAVRASVV